MSGLPVFFVDSDPALDEPLATPEGASLLVQLWVLVSTAIAIGLSAAHITFTLFR